MGSGLSVVQMEKKPKTLVGDGLGTTLKKKKGSETAPVGCNKGYRFKELREERDQYRP